tara:strand:- start:399 stop:563 length:165 start_codon:yes stop_codon:yes gene_type:complete
VGKIAVYQIKGNESTAVAQVYITVYGRAAYVHPYVGTVKRFKLFLLTTQGIIEE